ncbi:MAG: hypothetical protein DRI57_22515 [Deltaproteobacteria bacterium]|nr:MAG: hypothetical protein DRI57_22515 [Deltaproteobacteria bacterium]
MNMEFQQERGLWQILKVRPETLVLFLTALKISDYNAFWGRYNSSRLHPAPFFARLHAGSPGGRRECAEIGDIDTPEGAELLICVHVISTG